MDSMNYVISSKSFKLPTFMKIILTLLVIFIIFILNYKISIYDTYEAVVVKKGDDYYVQTMVRTDKQVFIHDNTLLINGKEYTYRVLNIDDYIYIDNQKYMIVNISIDLEKEYKINNNYLNLKQKRKKETLFKLIFEKLKKGIYL